LYLSYYIWCQYNRSLVNPQMIPASGGTTRKYAICPPQTKGKRWLSRDFVWPLCLQESGAHRRKPDPELRIRNIGEARIKPFLFRCIERGRRRALARRLLVDWRLDKLKARNRAVAEVAVHPLDDQGLEMLKLGRPARGDANAKRCLAVALAREAEPFRARGVGKIGADNRAPVIENVRLGEAALYQGGAGGFPDQRGDGFRSRRACLSHRDPLLVKLSL